MLYYNIRRLRGLYTNGVFQVANNDCTDSTNTQNSRGLNEQIYEKRLLEKQTDKNTTTQRNKLNTKGNMRNNLNRTKSADAILLTIIFLKFNFDPNKKTFQKKSILIWMNRQMAWDMWRDKFNDNIRVVSEFSQNITQNGITWNVYTQFNENVRVCVALLNAPPVQCCVD